MTRKGRLGPGYFVCLDKPEGPTSFDLVRQVRKVSGYLRAGHGGTLDPFATGLLVIAVGSATRLLRFFSDGDKRYRATFRFGVATDSDDATGAVLTTAEVAFDRPQLERALAASVGTVLQRPPRVSAIKVDGERAYALHRTGVSFPELQPRPVRIHDIQLEDFTPPTATLVVDCGKGTYIRSLARDLGEALGCGAHVASLRRERVGWLDVRQAVPPEAFAAEWSARGARSPGVLAPPAALAALPQVEVADPEAARVRCGQLGAAAAERVIEAAELATDAAVGAGRADAADAGGRCVVLLDRAGDLVAVARVHDEVAQLMVVMPEQDHGDVPGSI